MAIGPIIAPNHHAILPRINQSSMLIVTRITCIEHMTYASRAYILSALQQRMEESIIHQSTTHTYHNAVIFVPVDKSMCSDNQSSENNIIVEPNNALLPVSRASTILKA